MVASRFENPGADQLAGIAQRLREGESLIAQFNGPAHTPALLRELDGLCATFGERLEIRTFSRASES